MYGLFRKIQNISIPIDLQLKLFDSLVTPILLYSAEVWGFENNGNIEKKHVNDIKATPNKIILLVGIIIGIVVTLFLWIYFGAIGTISGIIPILFWNEQMKSSKIFNSYMLGRKKNPGSE